MSAREALYFSVAHKVISDLVDHEYDESRILIHERTSLMTTLDVKSKTASMSAERRSDHSRFYDC